MDSINVLIYNESKNPNPTYAKVGDYGCDVRASMSHTIANHDKKLGSNWEVFPLKNAVQILPGGRALIGTGIFCEIPCGFSISIRPRSGVALNDGVTVCNTPGTVDCGYRSEIGVILINHSDKPFIIHDGDRIAQFIIEETKQIVWQPVKSKDELSSSIRGQGGFGSTGV